VARHTCGFFVGEGAEVEECGKPAVDKVWVWVCGYARSVAASMGEPEPSEDLWLCAEHYDAWNDFGKVLD
jgi:hypothetical protein